MSDEERRQLAIAGEWSRLSTTPEAIPIARVIPVPPMALETPPPPTSCKTPSPLVAETVDRYLQDGKTSGRWTDKSAHEVEAILRTPSEILQGVQMSLVTYQTMLDVKEKLARLPANLHKNPEFRGKSVADVLQMEIPKLSTPLP